MHTNTYLVQRQKVKKTNNEINSTPFQLFAKEFLYKHRKVEFNKGV